jgi:hypothetical protein
MAEYVFEWSHMKTKGWKHLVDGCSFKGDGSFPIEAYSEFMPPPRLGIKPYGPRLDGTFSEDDFFGLPITEYEEHFELRPGMEDVARQILFALTKLVSTGKAEGLFRGELVNNPYWPPELSQKAASLKDERFTLILPLALSRTQDDKGRVRWTLFGGSEQGPSRPYWKGFWESPDKQVDESTGTGFLTSLLNSAYGTSCDSVASLRDAGFRIHAASPDKDADLRPAWTAPLIWRDGMPIDDIRYLLTFEPFASLSTEVKDAYLGSRLHLLPFPGSLLFWGVPGAVAMQAQYPFAMQVPLQHLIGRHESPGNLRVPQSGWIHEAKPGQPAPEGHFRNMFRRTHRWERVTRHDKMAVDGRDERVVHVLFSTAGDDLGLYGKPLARNSVIWGDGHGLLLDGPRADRRQVLDALKVIKEGGIFGYRWQFPPMRVGNHEIYWHRPLVAHMAPGGKGVKLLDSAPAGYMTAYRADQPNLENPVELWPRILHRDLALKAVHFAQSGHLEPKTLTRVLNLLSARSNLGLKVLPACLARQLLMLPRKRTLQKWMDSIVDHAGGSREARWFVGQLKAIIDTSDEPLTPSSITFDQTATRSFEEEFWRTIASLAHGDFVTKCNADCIHDHPTQRKLTHKHRDLDPLGDYLIDYHSRLIASAGMQGRALVGEMPFRWDTAHDYEWWGGWAKDRADGRSERNIVVVIPGRDRSRAVVMADHYDTAYMEDIYEKDRGGSGARLAASGADDNHSATATIMLGAPIFLRMAAEGKLACDVWLVHLTGEEFPADCLGARHLSQKLVEGTMATKLPDGRDVDLSKAKVEGVFVMDMIAHNTERDPDVFQIAPGAGKDSVRLAWHTHKVCDLWNDMAARLNQAPARKGLGPGKRSSDKDAVPAVAAHTILDGQVRLNRDPRSALFNTDGQILSDAGIPVILLMENYDINRSGYHDTKDTMENIDLDYGSAVAAIAIETVASLASS